MTKFVLDSLEYDSKKSRAKAKITNVLGSSVTISGDTIEVKYISDANKVAQILNEEDIKYSGG